MTHLFTKLKDHLIHLMWKPDEEREEPTFEKLMQMFKDYETEDHFQLTEVEGMECKEYSGVITHLTDKAATIDHQFMFHTKHSKEQSLRVGARVKCKLYTNQENLLVRCVELDETTPPEPEDKLPSYEKDKDGAEVMGHITKRFGRDIVVSISDGLEQDSISFSLNHVCAEFIPCEGDLVLLYVQNNNGDVVVNRMMPAITVNRMGKVTRWQETKGIIGNFATFTCLTCEPGYQPNVEDKVFASLIKTTNKKYPWRAIQVIPQGKILKSGGSHGIIDAPSDLLCDKEGITIEVKDSKISLNFNESTEIIAKVNNTGSVKRKILDCRLFSLKEYSQLKLLSPNFDTAVTLGPNESIDFTFNITGLYLGRSTEVYVWLFDGFKIGRSFDLDVSDPRYEVNIVKDISSDNTPKKEVTAIQLLERTSGVIMPGRRSFSPAAFVPVKLGQFALPENIITVALPEHKLSLDDHMIKVETILPDLREDLGPNTYVSRMHNLLFLEEAAMLKQVGELEMERAKFVQKENCLVLTVPPLSPYTTKLVAGDMLIARSPNPNLNCPAETRKYEGIIHKVTQTELWLQFSQDFHDLYNPKKKYSVSFVTSRASLRRMHQAVNLAVKHLGMDWLFPSSVTEREPQVILDEEEEEASSNWSLEALLERKRKEDLKRGNKSTLIDNLKYVLKMKQKKKELDTLTVGDQGPSQQGLSTIEVLLKTSDPRKHTAHLQNVPRPEMLTSGGASNLGRGRDKRSHSRDIHWNRHGSGYGKYCTVDNEQVNKQSFNSKRKKIRWFNSGLNKQQKDTVRNVLLGKARPLPYVIFGPPGTGKTVTVVETILQLFALVPDSRLLVATPSNSAADLITERLIEPGILKQRDLMRLVGYHYLEQGRIPADIAPFSSVPDVKAINIYGTTGNSYEGVQMCSREMLGRHRITVGTLGCLGLLYNMGFPRGHFTHVIIDEAGQATEPEVLIPMVFLHMQFGQVVLAGDPLQLGPVVTSRLASRYGLQDSLLARLLDRFPYTRDPVGFPDTNGYDPRLVTKLIHNYRSLPTILNLTSMMFYDNDLIPNVSEKNSVEAGILRALSHSLPCSEPGQALPILFHGVRGQNLQERESHSWYNPEEVVQVIRYLNILYQVGLQPHQLGIITPYQLQSNKIRLLLESMKQEAPKVGSVEEFQGQEKLAIVVSIVRSNQDEISPDMQRALGFVANGRRLNVALTRARALLIILGNPHLLSLDTHWRTVLQYCIKQNAYIGCDLPPELLHTQKAEKLET